MAVSAAKNVVLFGATGTIGRATAQAMRADGHNVTIVARRCPSMPGFQAKIAEIDDYPNLDLTGFDAVVSCLASRTGTPHEAWAIDHDAHVALLDAAMRAQVPQFVLLSALCVQKPVLAFQKAKAAFEAQLPPSGLTYSIVRPTAFFKSVSGQVKRVQRGKPFLLFGDGERTACKPISDMDLGLYLSRCLTDPALQNAILPIGGPGPALTPRAQGEMLFDLIGTAPRFRSVPFWLMDAIVLGLSMGGAFSSRMKAKSELAKIGRYYATEAMLVWNGSRYDADATPSFGTDTLRDHYRDLLSGKVSVDLGDHAVF